MKALYHLLLIAGVIVVGTVLFNTITNFLVLMIVAFFAGVIWRLIFDVLWVIFGGNRNFTAYRSVDGRSVDG